MELNIDAKCEGKLNCASKNNMRNLANFHQSALKSQDWDFDGILYPKQERYDLKIYRRALYHDNGE